MVLKVALRIRFLKLPNLVEERIFKASLVIRRVEESSFQDVMAIVENKVTFMELSLLKHIVTVFFKEDNGDRVVVDDGYYAELLKSWVKAAVPVDGSDSGEDDDGEAHMETSATIEVEVTASSSSSNFDLTPHHHSTDVLTEQRVVKPAPLTIENLAKVKQAPLFSLGEHHHSGGNVAASPVADLRTRVGQLTCPPANAAFFLRCVILGIYFKNPKPNLVVAELDLGDADNPTEEQITAVTFDEQVHKAIRENLRGDLRHIIEVRNAYVRKKTETEVRFQRNRHPLMLRLDKTCKLEVVQILSTPVTMPRGTPSTIVTVRDRLAPNGVLDVGNISQRGGLTGAPASSSSSSAGARRTVFVFDNAVGGSHVGQSVGELGRQNTRHQQELLKRQRVEEDSFLLNATNLNYATASDIRRREPLLEQHANREEKAVERIKKKAPVSTACLICKLDLENEEETLGTVEYFLSRHSTKQGCTMPTLEVLKNSLCDQRPDKKGKRLYCTSRFVDQQSKTVHLVHPRCVHLCTQYQRGDRLEDVLQLEANLTSCTLCGQLGATVKCYHPKCDRTFHVVCALFSNGYVNFGDRDPFLPCPACPSHTHVPMNAKAAKNVVVGSNASVFEDNIAFDSRVVDASDLRDPDEGDGW